MTNLDHAPTLSLPSTHPSLTTRILRTIARSGGQPSRLLTGRRGFALWGLVEVTGRTSGRTYRIPIAIAPTGGGFVIPLPFGAATQWTKNVLANRSATIKWNGGTYTVTDPVVIPTSEAAPYWMAVIRAVLGGVGIQDFLGVRIA
jgi:deazaflavin-dependent oxidoreductase (nitroreductase family)